MTVPFNTFVTGLTAATLTGAKTVPLVQGSTSKNTTTAAIAALASGGGTPSTIKDLVYWLKSDNVVLNANSGKRIYSYPNYAPTNNSIIYVPSRSGVYATYSGVLLNGLGTISLGGGEHYFASSQFLGPVLDEGTVFVVAKTSGLAASTYGYSICTGQGSNAFELRVSNNGTLQMTDGVRTISGSGGTTITDGAFFQFNGQYSTASTSYSFRISRASAGYGTGGTLNVTGPSLALLWYDTSGLNLDFIGQVAEIIIYNRSLTLTEVQGVESYLNTKWGV